MITSVRDSLALAILTADCVPILVVDKASNYYGSNTFWVERSKLWVL